MIKNGLIRALRGCFVWKRIKRKYHIDERTAVIVLPENDVVWNQAALKYLPDYIIRKNADRAIVFLTDESKESISTDYIDNDNISFECIKRFQACLLSDYYCLNRFYDKIQIFFLDYPYDNKSGDILNNTDVTADELVCLSFYILREVPAHV